MSKKLFFTLTGVILLTFLFSFTAGTPLMAQEESEDVMDMELEDLLNVEITTAGKTAEKISEIPASVVLITRAEIEKYGYRNLQEVLESVPGIYAVDQWALPQTTLGVRGFWAPFTREIVIMVNGVDQRQDVYSHYPLQKIGVPVEAIDRVEVIRGPMSVIYGSGAFFGAINIITNDVKDGKSTGVVAVGYGSNETKKAVVRAVGGGEDFSISMNASIYDDNGMDVPWSDMSSAANYTGLNTDGYFIEKTKYFNVSASYKGFYADISYANVLKPWYFVLAVPTKVTDKRNDHVTAKIGFQKDLSKTLTLDVKFGWYHTTILSELLLAYDPVTTPYNKYSTWNQNSSSYDLAADVHIHPSEKFNVSIGAYYRRLMAWQEQLNSPTLPLGDAFLRQEPGFNQETGAAYFQANWKPSKKFKIVAGARIEKIGATQIEFPIAFGVPGHPVLTIPYKARDMQFVPRLALIYSINDKNIVKFLYGKAVRMPSQLDNVDNPDIEPQYINTLELNYIASFSAKFTLNLSVYRNMMDKLIYRKEWQEGGVYMHASTNEGKMNTNGVEITVKAKPFKNFEMDLSLAYQDTEDENAKDRDVMNSPKVLAYIKMCYNFTKDISFAMNANYVDKMVSQWDNGQRIGDEAPSYFNVGANLRIDNLFQKGWFASFRVSNLFDTEIRYTAYSHSAWANKGILGVGRVFLFTVGKKFK